jgi:beta-glucosidase
MSSFNVVDGVPATTNKWLLTDLLRKQWGFKGFVVSDYTSVNEMTNHGLGDLQTVSALALKAGLDMDMVGEGFLTTLKKSLQQGKVTRPILIWPAAACWKPNINWDFLITLINQ